MTYPWPDQPEPSAEEVAARVAVEQHGTVLLIRMTRPEKRNAIDAAMTRGLDEALDRLDDDAGLRCGVLAGGEQAFCAGTDVSVGPGRPTARGGNYGVVARRRRTPLIAAVEGLAYGGGFEVALACDLVVAATTARFALPEVGLGLVANCGALFRTPRALSPAVARRLLLTGDPIDAARAYELGLVTDLVGPGEAEGAALAVAQRIAERSPAAVSASLAAVDSAVLEADARGWADTDAAVAAIIDGPERAEGLAAFREKRTPVWPPAR